jgi:hypothetical protein
MDLGSTNEIIILYLIVMAFTFNHEIAMAVIIKYIVRDSIACRCLIKANPFQVVRYNVVIQPIVTTVEKPE